MLQVHDIHKSFGKKEVLKGIDLKVDKGDVIAVIGPSGSGKTTLLRCINFLEKADKGTICINDLEVDAKNASKHEILEIRRKTAMVFQNYNLFQNKTALENIIEGPVIVKGVPEEEARARGMQILRRVGMEDKSDRYPTQLSGGEQQRVGIARALMLNPEVILFDEPTSALDPELVGEVLEVIRDVVSEGIPTIIVTHEISFARDVSDWIVFMDEGVIVEQNNPAELLGNPQNERTRRFLDRIIRNG